jgi:DNA-binding MarR family transcriptional regulator
MNPMDDFIQRQGPAYLAHILRRLADELVRGGAEWYPEVGVTAPPRTTSTLLALDEHGPLGVTELSVLLRQSHPLVIDWRRQLTELGLVETRPDPEDGRRSVLSLTAEGRREVRRLRRALVIMEKASRRLLEHGGPDLFAALWRMDDALERQPFVESLREHAARAKAHQD